MSHDVLREISRAVYDDARAGYSDVLPADVLARAGYEYLRGQHDHDEVCRILCEAEPRSRGHGLLGALWIVPITWPDRVPAAKTWAGRQTLHGIIAARQTLLRRMMSEGASLWASVPMKGASGIDSYSVITAIDAGFSLDRQGMPRMTRPGVELLAILGAEVCPMISISSTRIGAIVDGAVYEWDSVRRDPDSYYRHWTGLSYRGDVRRHA